VLAATLNVTVPEASLFCPLATAIQLASLEALQWQPVRVVTSTDSRPPSAPIESALRLSEKVHGAAA